MVLLWETINLLMHIIRMECTISMNATKEDNLIALLEEWFKEIDFTKRHVWCRDRIAKFIKQKLTLSGHFKRGVRVKRQIIAAPVVTPVKSNDDW